MHPFNVGSFSWAGSHNLLVEACYDNTSYTYAGDAATQVTFYAAAGAWKPAGAPASSAAPR